VEAIAILSGARDYLSDTNRWCSGELFNGSKSCAMGAVTRMAVSTPPAQLAIRALVDTVPLTSEQQSHPVTFNWAIRQVGGLFNDFLYDQWQRTGDSEYHEAMLAHFDTAIALLKGEVSL